MPPLAGAGGSRYGSAATRSNVPGPPNPSPPFLERRFTIACRRSGQNGEAGEPPPSLRALPLDWMAGLAGAPHPPILRAFRRERTKRYSVRVFTVGGHRSRSAGAPVGRVVETPTLCSVLGPCTAEGSPPKRRQWCACMANAVWLGRGAHTPPRSTVNRSPQFISHAKVERSRVRLLHGERAVSFSRALSAKTGRAALPFPPPFFVAARARRRSLASDLIAPSPAVCIKPASPGTPRIPLGGPDCSAACAMRGELDAAGTVLAHSTGRGLAAIRGPGANSGTSSTHFLRPVVLQAAERSRCPRFEPGHRKRAVKYPAREEPGGAGSSSGIFLELKALSASAFT